MIAFKVEDMTCNHCVGTITRAVREVDRNAQIRIDLATHRVEVDGGAADAQALRHAIEEAGYTPQPA